VIGASVTGPTSIKPTPKRASAGSAVIEGSTPAPMPIGLSKVMPQAHKVDHRRAEARHAQRTQPAQHNPTGALRR
jgi:hypothetical protein